MSGIQNPTQYTFDAAFGSNDRPDPNATQDPMGMTYGFSYLQIVNGIPTYTMSGSMPESLNAGDQIVFCVLDTDKETGGTFQNVTFRFKKSIHTQKQKYSCPFQNAQNDSINFSASQAMLKLSPATSAGCNLLGTLWAFGDPDATQPESPTLTTLVGFTVNYPGCFDCTITANVSVDPNSNNGCSTLKFEVDPEMDVTEPPPVED